MKESLRIEGQDARREKTKNQIQNMKLTESIALHKTESDARARAYDAAEAAIRAIRPLTTDIFELLDERDPEADALRSSLSLLGDARCAAGEAAHNRHIARISA